MEDQVHLARHIFIQEAELLRAKLEECISRGKTFEEAKKIYLQYKEVSTAIDNIDGRSRRNNYLVERKS
ncbi:MAG: hypothetical protein JNK79_14150 [Chitinophagaceae bacterium]|nr:hypothetical protein [Chitinophagaceae bacterium]